VTILGWWRDWRERRSALTEMNALRQHHEAVLMDQSQNPLHLAQLCLVSGDLEEVAAQWDRARVLLPDAVLRTPESLDILLKLKRYDEGEDLARRRLKLFPGDRFALLGLARIAEARGDNAEALRRWEVVRRRVKDTVEGYIGCARCLAAMGKLDDAAVQLDRAVFYDPASHGALVARAMLCDRRKAWPRSIEQWKYIADFFKDGPAFGSAAKAMVELGQIDEAEAFLEEPSRIYTRSIEIALTRTQLAERRGDLTAACGRWETVRSMDPFFHPGYHEGARCLAETNRHAEADQVMAAAIAQFPGQAWPTREYARLAHNRKDWNEAAARWSVLREKFPDEPEGYSLGAAAAEAAASRSGP
jgi:tetratricopeptide (TPR) repeat protein